MTLPLPPLLLNRPWLSLYGNFLKPQINPPAQQQQHEQPEVQVELAPIQELLPDEMLQHVLARLSPYMLGHIACVCRQWRSMAEVGSREQYADWRNCLHCCAYFKPSLGQASPPSVCLLSACICIKGHHSDSVLLT